MPDLTDEQLDQIEARAAHLYEYTDLPADAEILAGSEVPALVAEARRMRAALTRVRDWTQVEPVANPEWNAGYLAALADIHACLDTPPTEETP